MPETKKSLGQHWLSDAAALGTMADAGQVKEGDEVLEIGPGTGTLTQVLLDRGASVTAIELDEWLVIGLTSRFKDRPLNVVVGSILEFDFGTMPAGYKVVANIPYYLTSNLIRVLSESSNPPAMAVLLVQKEVAERVAAGPGSMSLLSVSAQFYWQVSVGRVVPAKLFTPAPKVDSQILILKGRESPLFPGSDPGKFFHLVKAGFSSRRKTLLNSLAGGLRLEKPEVMTRLEAADMNPKCRPQELSLEDWHRLYEQFEVT